MVLFLNISVFFFCAGEQADLIFVFFDPMGQALCKRTLNIVEKLSEKCGDKLMFYLSKADEAGSETDRQVGPSRIDLSPSSWELRRSETAPLFASAEGDDADCSGTVSPSRPQQVWLWDADDIHPQPAEGYTLVLPSVFDYTFQLHSIFLFNFFYS